jgi:hypothetical protein
MKKQTIKVTVLLENSFWVGIFERTDEKNYSVARNIFGKEPTDAELYEFISHHYHELKFTSPQDFTLVIKRMSPKRIQREVRKEMEKAKSKVQEHPKESIAQETLRLELEKNKKVKKAQSKLEKEASEQRKFELNQAKRKQKHRGH